MFAFLPLPYLKNQNEIIFPEVDKKECPFFSVTLSSRHYIGNHKKSQPKYYRSLLELFLFQVSCYNEPEKLIGRSVFIFNLFSSSLLLLHV